MNVLLLLEESLDGNLTNFLDLMSVKHEELIEASKSFPVLILLRLSILQVLDNFKKLHVKPHIVQNWASFMLRGYVSTKSIGTITPLQIEYELNYEDKIVEVLARLDELGDEVDGLIGEYEIDKLINMLK